LGIGDSKKKIQNTRLSHPIILLRDWFYRRKHTPSNHRCSKTHYICKSLTMRKSSFSWLPNLGLNYPHSLTKEALASRINSRPAIQGLSFSYLRHLYACSMVLLLCLSCWAIYLTRTTCVSASHWSYIFPYYRLSVRRVGRLEQLYVQHKM
jgi:hypothetical protein